MNKQHFQLPNDMTKDGKLTPNDLLVYVTIKSFYVSQGLERFLKNVDFLYQLLEIL
jgi:hypothetical protein